MLTAEEKCAYDMSQRLEEHAECATPLPKPCATDSLQVVKVQASTYDVVPTAREGTTDVCNSDSNTIKGHTSGRKRCNGTAETTTTARPHGQLVSAERFAPSISIPPP